MISLPAAFKRVFSVGSCFSRLLSAAGRVMIHREFRYKARVVVNHSSEEGDLIAKTP